MALGAVFNTAVSGLGLNARRVAQSADNLVNISTPGYQPGRIDAVSVSSAGQGGGVRGMGRSIVVQAPDPGAAIVGEFSNLIQAQAAYRANVETLRAADEMLHGAFDLKA